MASISHFLLDGPQTRRPSADGGAVTAEYGLLLTLLAIVVAVVLPAFGIAVRDLFLLPIPL